MKTNRQARMLTAGITALAVLAGGTARAARQVIDRVVAVVEDEAIFQSDVEQGVRQIMIQRGSTTVPAGERDALYKDALENIINDRLVIVQAGRLGIDIPFSDVEAQVNKALDENKKALGGEEAFQRQLEAEGLSIDELKKLYRTQVRNRMLVERVLQRDMARERGPASEDELRRYYNENRDKLPPRPAVVNLQTIFIGFETSSGATSKSRDKIIALRERVTTGGEDFAEVAKAESDDPSGPLGGDLGFVQPADLREPAFAAAVAGLDVGAISEPVLTVYGYHLIQVTEKRPETNEVRIRHILVRAEPTELDIQEVFSTATSVYESIRTGASFDSLAARYNTDPAAGENGTLGWLRLEQLPQFFRDVLVSMQPGDVSQVFRESTGFRIVKLIGREEARPYEYAEIKEDLQRLYEQERFGNTYESYVAELRKKFPIDYRL